MAGAILLLVITVHMVVPVYLGELLRRQVQVTGYQTSFSDLSISLSRGSYTVHNARLYCECMANTAMEAREIEFGLAGFENGKWLGKITVRNPRMVFSDSTDIEDGRGVGVYPFRILASKLMVVPLDEILITNGHLHFVDLKLNARSPLEMHNISIHISNLTSKPREDNELVARANGRSDVYGGKLRFTVNFDPTNSAPEFNVRARLENLDLSYIRDYLKAYGGHSIDEGLFSMLAEARGDEEVITGLVKPLLQNTYMASNRGSQPLKFYKAHNPFTRPFPQISFHGNMDYAASSLWSAVAFTLRNAFLEALTPIIQKIDGGEKKSFRQQRVPRLPEKMGSS